MSCNVESLGFSICKIISSDNSDFLYYLDAFYFFGLIALFFFILLLFKFFILIFFKFFNFHNFILFLFLFYFFFFLPFLLTRVADVVLQPGVRPEPRKWESQVQDFGPPGTSQPHVISIGKSSPRDFHLNAPLNDQQAPVLDTPCQTTSKTETQPHPLAERLPKIIISSETPQNTPPDMVLPTRKTRSSLIHQNTGTSPLHQEADTTH